MHAVRLIPLFALASTALAQLPPTALRPAQPAKPAAPAVPATPAPAVSGLPASVTSAVPKPTDLSNAIPNTLTAEEKAEGWMLFFDGTKAIGLSGLQKSDPFSSGWKIQNGELTLPKEIKDMDRTTGGDLISMGQFWDFEFRFEWKSTVSANSGIRYFISRSGSSTPSGLEYQIIDDVHSSLGLKGGPLRRSGSLDNVLPVGGKARLRTADPLSGGRREEPWNEGRIVVQGNNVQHWLNGELAVEFQLGPHLRQLADKNRTSDNKSPRPHALFGMKTKTQIVLLDEGTEVAFRNLKVRQLSPKAIVAPTTSGPAVVKPSAIPNPFLLPPKK